ncbi:hypothetical protein [Rhizobium sp. CSW-27]|uniref:hypothetical protein n=1 Tax=Rhizobium sp. CSW-27 TaxID=2839985 RepID=UPI001C011EE5|nr:hypothetical protein [Rhizobium sp. CSW-27]MBT9370279.1 hypothetical protein [Rhizobium sp. CSW-27]
MSIRVIVPPDPLVEPEDVGGGTNAEIMIAAVTAAIDGPDGWLGRALGPQTLELGLDLWPCRTLRLPYPPLIAVEGVYYTDVNGDEQEVALDVWGNTAAHVWFKQSWAMPALAEIPDAVRIRYRAGYDGVSVMDGGTGAVPPQVRQAIILSVQHLRSIGAENLFLRAEEVEGVGRTEYTVSEQAGRIIEAACERLLFGLKVFA